MNKYNIVEIDLSHYDKSVQNLFSVIASELQLIQKQLDLYEIAVRGGFVADTLKGIQAKDIDVFYVLKDSSGNPSLLCDCDTVKSTIMSMKLELIGDKYELDVGHFGEKEFYIPVVEKICGFFSHHADFYSMYVLTSEGKVFTNEMGKYCHDHSVYEVTLNTWPMTQNFLTNHQNDYYDIYNGFTFRGLRQMIRKQLTPGEDYKTMLENWHSILRCTQSMPQIKDKLANRFSKHDISLSRLKSILDANNIQNADLIIKELKNIISI
ncbi:MAG: hypothetical protein QY314_00520 [Candidatus Dojkabacteria bacterium]|nr:MAG: hypothetical protein QY314_00520 [Candidatus Dojkabacteria bacterium]